MSPISSSAATALRRYSTRSTMSADISRLQLLLAHSAITLGVMLPFVHPYLQSRQAKRDGSYLTKPRISFTPSPKF